jgi:transcriptional regulator with XRE-family HTH domain
MRRPFPRFPKHHAGVNAASYASEYGDVLVARDFDFTRPPRHRCRARAVDIAEALEFRIAVAEHARDVLLGYCDGAPGNGKLVDAEPLREVLPMTLDATFRAEMRRNGVASSTLYRIKSGGRVRPETFEKIAEALGRPDLVAAHAPRTESADVPVDELAQDVRRAGYDCRCPKAVVWANDPDAESFEELPADVRALAYEFFWARVESTIEEAAHLSKIKRPIAPATVRDWRRRARTA